MYSPTVLDHFQAPRNVGEMPDADAIGEAGNPINGNSITLYLKIAGDRIVKAAFRAYGCPATVAAGSAVTEWLIDKRLEEVQLIESNTIERVLDGLPPTKRHCSVMAADAAREAVVAYRKQRT